MLMLAFLSICPFLFLCFRDWNKFFQLFFIKNKFSCWNHEFISMS